MVKKLKLEYLQHVHETHKQTSRLYTRRAPCL